MDRKSALENIKELKKEAEAKKKKFIQSVDLIVNLQDLDFKKPEHQIDFFVSLPHNVGKKKKVCVLADIDLAEEAKACDTTVMLINFDEYSQSKKKIRKLAKNHDFFVAQANIMPKVATVFGRVLGPKNKMPNPKAGCVVPPRTNLKPLYERLQKTVRVMAKIKPSIQVMVGKEDMKDEDLAENLYFLYDQIIHHLPGEKNNLKNMYLKMTMGKPLKID